MEEAEKIKKQFHALSLKSKRFTPEAFLLITEAMMKTREWVKKGVLREDDPAGVTRESTQGGFHISGRELLSGLKKIAFERWGRMATTVLSMWGMKDCEDVGEIVFMMLEEPDIGWNKREEDTREDFLGGPLASAFDRWE